MSTWSLPIEVAVVPPTVAVAPSHTVFARAERVVVAARPMPPTASWPMVKVSEPAAVRPDTVEVVPAVEAASPKVVLEVAEPPRFAVAVKAVVLVPTEIVVLSIPEMVSVPATVAVALFLTLVPDVPTLLALAV